MADIHILVADDSAGQRLDAYLGANDGCPTRSACAHLIEGGAVAVNGETCLSKKYAVRAGDRISVDLPEPHDPTELDVLLERDLEAVEFGLARRDARLGAGRARP